MQARLPFLTMIPWRCSRLGVFALYLSCIDLDLSRRKVLETITSPYRTHAAIEGLFGSDAVREDKNCRILWRVDDSGSPERARLYIVSPEAPAASEAVTRFGVDENAVASKDYLPFSSKAAQGDVWRFRLKANPVRRVLVDKGRRPNEGVVGTIQGHVTVAQQLDWLESHAEPNGFCLVDDVSDVVVSHRSREVFSRAGRKVTLVTVQFDGILRVDDSDKFKHALGFGIGRAKGFGCGLMTIASL